MKFFIKDFFSKYDQIGRKMQIWAHLLKKSLMEKLHFLCSDKDTVRGAFFCFPKFQAKCNPFHASGLFLYPLKTSVMFFDVLKGIEIDNDVK